MEQKRLDVETPPTAELEAALVLLTGAVTSLPEVARRVHPLSARDGCSHDEIAKRLGIDIWEVSRQLASALVEFDRAWHPD